MKKIKIECEKESEDYLEISKSPFETLRINIREEQEQTAVFINRDKAQILIEKLSEFIEEDNV